MRIITHKRYALLNGRPTRESHTFSARRDGFTLPRDLFPAAEGLRYVVSFVGNAFYETSADPTDYPLDNPLKPGITLITEEEYQQALEDQSNKLVTRPPYLADTVQQNRMTDEAKIFFIDYYGDRARTVATEREWFNRMFGFDPVDDDPR